MNYQRIYDEFIADRRIKEPSLIGYTEKHHVLPRSLGGDNSKSNLIQLSAQDHYFAHELLAKIHGGKMWAALFLMSNSASNSAKGAKVNRINFEKAKIKYSKYQQIRMTGKGNHFYGRTHSKETINKIIKSRNLPKGADHAFCNKLVTTWENMHTGEKLTCNQNELRHKYNLNHRAISAVFNGKRKSYKGWFSNDHQNLESIINPKNKGAEHYKSDQKIYIFEHKNGETFNGTRQEFYNSEHGVDERGVRALISGRCKSTRGWLLIGVENA